MLKDPTFLYTFQHSMLSFFIITTNMQNCIKYINYKPKKKYKFITNVKAFFMSRDKIIHNSCKMLVWKSSGVIREVINFNFSYLLFNLSFFLFKKKILHENQMIKKKKSLVQFLLFILDSFPLKNRWILAKFFFSFHQN